MKDYKEYVDKIVKGAKELAGTVTEKTKQTADLAKIKLDEKSAVRDLDKAYQAMGRVMYQIEIGTLQRDEQIINAACQQVSQAEERLANLRQAAEDIKKRSEEEEAQKTEETPADEPERDKNGYFVLKFCPYCKVGNHPEATHCVSCGKEI